MEELRAELAFEARDRLRDGGARNAELRGAALKLRA
jgi:hypothetical protein